MQQLEGALPSVSARMKTLERNNPLEARLRILEARLSPTSGARQQMSAMMVIWAIISWPRDLLHRAITTCRARLPVEASCSATTSWAAAEVAAAIIDSAAATFVSTADNFERPQEAPDSEGFRFVLKPGLDGYSQSLSLVDIEDCDHQRSRLSDRAKISILHTEAVMRGLDNYDDPATGYEVFTAHHLKTRECCGSSCRHCPWGHRNVPGNKRNGRSLKFAEAHRPEAQTSQEEAAEPSTEAVAAPSSPTEPFTRLPAPGPVEPGVGAEASPHEAAQALESRGWRQSRPEAARDAALLAEGRPPKSRLYTRKGDAGWGTLYNEVSILKSDPIYEAIGAVDELNSAVGLAAQLLTAHQAAGQLTAHAELPSQLESVQAWLLDVGSALCTPRTSTTNSRKLQRTRGVRHEDVVLLERWIDEADAALTRLVSFILPGGSPGAAARHVARAVCRRAERHVWPLLMQGHADEELGIFLNRLSDYLFVAARLDAASAGGTDLAYKVQLHADLWQRQVVRVK